ncbi:MAG: hypothetical protein WKF89_09900 [Chitinophagaceae bacterium]
MERDFNNDEFEVFLKQKADQCKIYPSEKSWKTVHNALHSRWKFLTFGGSLLFLSGLFFFGNHFNTGKSSNSAAVNKTPGSQNNSVVIPFTPSFTPSNAINPLASNQVQSNESRGFSSLKNPVQAGAIARNSEQSTVNSNVDASARLIKLQPSLLINDLISERMSERDDVAFDKLMNEESNLFAADKMLITPLLEEKAAKQGEIKWLKEMSINNINLKKKSPFNLQFYFSPSVTYRRLADNKSSSHSNQQTIPLSSNNSNIDKYVDHKPSVGAGIGSNILFSASRNLTFKTGLQLNYSRYTIKAYKSYLQKASIALNSLGPVGDTITAYTSFRNFSGYSPEELQNQYLQLSVPIGAELKLLGNKRLQFTVAGTVQPTYLLLNDTYLLSSDYANYAKEPSLVRKWNVHTSMEAFVSYNVGGIRWQIGPQFRYQLLSSYNDRYTIREYLIEYGFRVGVSKTLR